MKYITMTTGGVYGNAFMAQDDDGATATARSAGYQVQDIIDTDLPGYDAIVVVA
jgi:hypothetical protein